MGINWRYIFVITMIVMVLLDCLQVSIRHAIHAPPSLGSIHYKIQSFHLQTTRAIQLSSLFPIAHLSMLLQNNTNKQTHIKQTNHSSFSSSASTPNGASPTSSSPWGTRPPTRWSRACTRCPSTSCTRVSCACVCVRARVRSYLHTHITKRPTNHPPTQHIDQPTNQPTHLTTHRTHPTI